MQQIKKLSLIECAETIFQILFLIYTILGFNSLTFGNPIISIFMWTSYLLGGILLLIRILNWKQYMKFPGIICLVFMCAICMISILINNQYDLKKNIIYLIFWVFYFFMFYMQSSEITFEKAIRRFNIIAHLISISAFVLSIISLIMMVYQYAEVIQINGEEVHRGFVYGRLYGAYLTPNSGAVFGCVAIFLSIHFFCKYKNIGYRLFALLNCVAQFLYIVLSDSRSGNLSLALGSTVYALFVTLFNDKIRKKKHRGVIIGITVIATAIVTLCAPKCTQNIYNGIVASVSESVEQSNLNSDSLTEQQSISDYQVDRGYSLEGDISNRRFDVWKSGLEIFKECPWFGTTFCGFLPYAKMYLPETYIVNNDYLQMNTLDNDFVNLLVSNGIFGFIAFLIFVVWIISFLLRRVSEQGKLEQKISVMMGVCTAVATFSMFTSGVLYMQAPYSVLFWLTLGTLVISVFRDSSGRKCSE